MGMHDMLRLNIGAGPWSLPGFENIDIQDGGIDAANLPYADGAVDEIYASHVLEHFDHTKTYEVMREWVRVLRPGGKLSISVPDIKKLIAHREQNPDFTDPMFQRYALGGKIDEHDVHGSLFTEDRLREYMMALGIEAIEPFRPVIRDSSAYTFSTNLYGVKRPEFGIKAKPKVVFVISQARLTFADTMNCCMDTVRALCAEYGMEWVPRMGQSWDQSLDNGMRAALAFNPDYIITIDFDGAFDKKDVLDLIDLMQRYRELACVFPVQMSRHEPYPLLFQPDADYSGEITMGRFAHFGLTVIRAEVIRNLPRPWFWAIPSPEGDFDTPFHSDTDITFWRTLGAHGYKIAQANRVVLGHIELHVRWPSVEHGLRIQPIDNYRRKGRPSGAVFDPAPFRNMLSGKSLADKNPTNYPAKYAGGMEWLRPHQGGWQFGESGLLQALCDRMKIACPTVVEIGGGDGNNIPTNIQFFRQATGIVYESDKDRRRVLRGNLDAMKLGAAVEVAGEFKIGVDRLPDGVDVLIVDVDGLEYQIVKEIVKSDGARLPPILMVEHHDLCDVTRWVGPDIAPPELAGKPINGFSFQSTINAIKRLVLDHYEPIVVTRVNSIYVRRDKWGVVSGDVPVGAERPLSPAPTSSSVLISAPDVVNPFSFGVNK